MGGGGECEFPSVFAKCDDSSSHKLFMISPRTRAEESRCKLSALAESCHGLDGN